MYRDESWHFLQLGRFVERTQLLAGLIDAQLAIFPASEQHPESDWLSLLRICGARRAYGRLFSLEVRPATVVNFLVTDPLLGEFKRSSQHLGKVWRWSRTGAGARIELCGDRCVRPVVPRWDAGSIGRGSGKKLLADRRARSRRWQPACLPLSGRAGFANVVACHLSVFVLRRGATYRSSSEKRLPSFKPAVMACARSPGSWAAQRQRSRESCGATQPHEVGASSIGPQPPNGMPIGERSVRKLPNSLRTAN